MVFVDLQKKTGDVRHLPGHHRAVSQGGFTMEDILTPEVCLLNGNIQSASFVFTIVKKTIILPAGKKILLRRNHA